jgi:hypothetical protein
MMITIMVLMLLACADPPRDELLLRALVEQAELAAEARDTGDLMAVIAPHYTGVQGEDRDGLARVVRGYFIMNQQVHVLTRIHRVEILADGGARIDLAVAMARTPLPEVGSLADSQADLFRIQLELSRVDGEWLVFGAEHQRAGPSDFL